jgi:hypothetical protein
MMNGRGVLTIAAVAMGVAVLGGATISAQDSGQEKVHAASSDPRRVSGSDF